MRPVSNHSVSRICGSAPDRHVTWRQLVCLSEGNIVLEPRIKESQLFQSGGRTAITSGQNSTLLGPSGLRSRHCMRDLARQLLSAEKTLNLQAML